MPFQYNKTTIKNVIYKVNTGFKLFLSLCCLWIISLLPQCDALIRENKEFLTEEERKGFLWNDEALLQKIKLSEMFFVYF